MVEYETQSMVPQLQHFLIV